MRMHIGRTVLAVGVAVVVAAGVAGTALAAVGASGSPAGTTAVTAAGPVTAAGGQSASYDGLTLKLAKEVGVPEAAMADALADVKKSVAASGATGATAEAIEVKVLTRDLGISSTGAERLVHELEAAGF